MLPGSSSALRIQYTIVLVVYAPLLSPAGADMTYYNHVCRKYGNRFPPGRVVSLKHEERRREAQVGVDHGD